MGNQISSKHGGLDSSLLDCRGLLKTIRVNTTKKLFGDFHTVKGLDRLVPVGVKVGVGQTAGVFSSLRCSLLRGRWFTEKLKKEMVSKTSDFINCYDGIPVNLKRTGFSQPPHNHTGASGPAITTIIATAKKRKSQI